MELLPLLDFDRLANAEPKWFSGFSDLSTIQVPLLLRSGWATLHGPNLMQLPEPSLDRISARVSDAWRCGAGATLNQFASDATGWRLLEGASRPLRFSGRLVGGCLDSISRLAGSKYGAVAAFGTSHSQDGIIVFLENAELKPFELARALRGLRYAGWFDNATGILIGRNAALEGGDVGAFTAQDAVESALSGMRCPVVLDVDVGHVAPQWSIVQGAKGTFEWVNRLGKLEQWLD